MSTSESAIKKLRFLVEPYDGRSGSQVLHSFNRGLSLAGVESLCHQSTSLMVRAGFALDKFGLIRNLYQRSDYAYIIALMWPRAARLFPVGYFNEVIPLCFDCWPINYQQWEHLFRVNKVRVAFFTARESAKHFELFIPGMACLWMPEAADPKEYDPGRALVDRKIDVLEYGRRHDAYHELITDKLSELGCRHTYATKKREGTGSKSNLRQHIFKDADELRAGLADTRITICFPRSVTHPGRVDKIETVTFRYFESMASKCLVVGHAPEELCEIFGYNPVIEVSSADAAQQLYVIITNIGSYQELVDRNYQRLCEVGTWDARAKKIIELLTPLGYQP